MHFFSLHLYTGKYLEFLEILKRPTARTLVFTPNPEILVRAYQDGDFLEILKGAQYLTPDANGLYTGSLMQEGYSYMRAIFVTLFQKKQLSEKYGELIKGSDLTRDLVRYASDGGERILMIDNYRIKNPENPFEIRKQEVQSKLGNLFAEKFPNLRIDIIFDGEDTPENIARTIIDHDIRYVFSCIGMKHQEERLVEIFAHLPDYQRVVGLGVGSSFDYLLGLQQRAPQIFQRLGIEWFYRLILSPSRWRRISTALWVFPRRVCCDKRG